MVKGIATTLINNHSYAFLLLNKTDSDNPYPSTVVVHVVASDLRKNELNNTFESSAL